MSVYAVHLLCRRIRRDAAFREELRGDPDGVLARFPLSGEERAALLAGDVAALERAGAHGYLLGTLGRFGFFGLDRERYVRRIKGLAER